MGLGFLHFHRCGSRYVIAAEGCVGPGGFGVEDGKDTSEGVDVVLEMLDKRLNEGLGNVVKSGPEEDYVELATAEVEILLEEAGDVEAGRAAFFFRRPGPSAGEGLVDQISHVNTMAEAGEEVNALRGSRADVEDAEVGLRLKVLEHGLPSAGVARDAGTGEHGAAGAVGLVLIAAKEITKHAYFEIPCIWGNSSFNLSKIHGLHGLIGCVEQGGGRGWRGSCVAGGGTLRRGKINLAGEDSILLDGEASGADVSFEV